MNERSTMSPSAAQWAAVLVTFLGSMVAYSSFLGWNESRAGVVLQDPVLNVFTPIDLSVPLFVLIYVGIVVFLMLHRSDMKHTLFVGLLSYTLLLLLRMLCMWVTPFDPPQTMITLVDPLATMFAAGKPMVRDLFFSGHTATMMLLTLLASKKWKWLFALCTLLIGCGVLLQHVHYTVDVLVAVLGAYGSYRLASVVISNWVKKNGAVLT